MKTVTVTAHLHASRGEVFSHVVDERKRFLTDNPVTEMQIVSAQTTGVGTMYRWKLTLPLGLRFRFDEIVTEWAEPERLAYRAVSGWDMEASALFEPDGNGTRETFTLRYRAPSP